MLDENHNDGGGKLVGESFDECLVDCWDCSVLESSGHREQDLEDRVLAVVSIHEPTDQGIKKNDERGSECRDEEKHFGSLGHLSSSKVTSTPYHVQHS